MTDLRINENRDEISGFLQDESRFPGEAESLSFPESVEEVVSILRYFHERKIPITLQGARTGVTGGAVPLSGHIMNLSRMDKITALRYNGEKKCFLLTTGPGLLLSNLRESLLSRNFDTSSWDLSSKKVLEQMTGSWIFPPDPTETSASIGGMAATNASGARSFHYGAMRNYINAMEVVLPGGQTVFLKRGENRCCGSHFSLIPGSLTGDLPAIKNRDIKNAAGYYIKEDMDLIDLFIGSEGTLGIITELELVLLPQPGSIWGITCFLQEESRAVAFVTDIRNRCRNQMAFLGAVEYFDSHSLWLLTREKKQNPAFSTIKDIPPQAEAAVYLEFHGKDEEDIMKPVEIMTEVLEKHGGNEDATWVATTPHEMESLTFFRHALPEAVNIKIGELKKNYPSITKLGTDLAVPGEKLGQVMDIYKKGLARSNLDYVIFGHIGDNHLHVNIIPHNDEEYNRGKRLYKEWALEIIGMEGTISAEHGIGKLKREFFRLMYGEKGVSQMSSLKKLFDPQNLLNRGNLFVSL